MKIYLSGVFISLFFALWLEFFYKFFATHDPENFFGSIIVYLPYLLILHKIFEYCKSIRLMYLIGGFSGLMAEWFLMGNSPWQNPEAFQLAMFVFHGFYPAYGYCQARQFFDSVRARRMLFSLGFMTLVSGTGFLFSNSDIRFIWFLLCPLIFYFYGSALLLKAQK